MARNFTPLVQIAVRAPTRVKAEKAANSLANTVTTEVVAVRRRRRCELLKQQIANDEAAARGHRRPHRRGARAAAGRERRHEPLARREAARLDELERHRERRRAAPWRPCAGPDQRSQLLSLAENVELSRVVQPAVAVRDVGDEPAQRRRDRRRSLGLLLGALAALVADPWLRRRSTAAA